MNGLIVKGVDLMGDTVMAAKDKDGNIWAGVSYFCNALGMQKWQKDKQIQKVQSDKALSRGCSKFGAGVFDPNNETVALRIDFIPMWLAKINITDKMQNEHPELADKLLEYQLKAKDILADAFLPKHQSESPAINPVEIPIGEIASYAKAMDRIFVRQQLAPHKIAEAFVMVSEQFGIHLPAGCVKTPEYEQLSLPIKEVQA